MAAGQAPTRSTTPLQATTPGSGTSHFEPRPVQFTTNACGRDASSACTTAGSGGTAVEEVAAAVVVPEELAAGDGDATAAASTNRRSAAPRSGSGAACAALYMCMAARSWPSESTFARSIRPPMARTSRAKNARYVLTCSVSVV